VNYIIPLVKAHRAEHGSSLAEAVHAVDAGWRPGPDPRDARIAELIFSRKGDHIVLAVSHDRCFNGGTKRIYGFEQSVKNVVNTGAFTSKVNKLTCPRGKSAICLQVEVEV